MARAALAELGQPGAGLLGADLTWLWLAPGIAADVDELTAALRAGLALPPGQGRDDALVGALANQAELLPDEPYADWADRARDRLDSLRQEARLALARDRAKGIGRSGPDDVAAAWFACFSTDPASEEAAGALIRLSLAQGRPEQAARVFERCRTALERLGLRVSPSLTSIYAAAGVRAESAAPPETSPGLLAPVPGASSVAAPSVAVPFRAGSAEAVPAAVAPPNVAAWSPREERRPLTMMFAEVIAPPGLAARLGLEELRDHVGGALAAVITEVEALGGTVSSVSGRGLQAMFGAPQAHEDDPERAVRAAYRALVAATSPAVIPGASTPVAGTPVVATSGAGTPVVGTSGAGTSVVGTSGASFPGAGSPGAGIPGTGSPGAGIWGAGALGAGSPQSRSPGAGTPDVRSPGVEGQATLRIGIESGPAIVGPLGGGARLEYAALGDVVSVAAALQSAARPGSVLVGPATKTATAHLFGWGADEEVPLAPGVKPLTASYLAAPLARTEDRRPRLGGSAPLIGRQAEQRSLDVALRGVVAGRGGTVLLTGEPGLGKSRLVQESRNRFIAWLGAGSGSRPLWLEGRSASHASATPYGVFRTLIAGWIGVAFDQSPSRIRAALADSLTRLMGNTNLLLPLGHLMGLPTSAERGLSSEEARRQTFTAVRALVTRFAATGPTVLVLEDLQWADPTSLQLTAELVKLAARRRLLVLATSRTDIGLASVGLTTQPARSTRSGARPVAQELRLRPLAAAAAEALATSLIGRVSTPEVLATVLATAEGNPLFLEERLAEMLDAGTLVRERGTWRLQESAEQPLPQVLERLVRSRVDRLSPAAAEAIRAAAVLGAEFTADSLALTLGTTPAALRPALEEMRASDLVHPEPQASAGPVFRFRHALIQEGTYLGLLRTERRDLHARAARALEAAASGRLPEVAAILGRHYARAEDADRAVHYLELAGDHATDAFANDEAIASFREALAIAEHAGEAMAADAVRLHAKLANVLWRTARVAEARTAFRAALRLADAGPHPLDPVLRAHLHTRLGRLEMVGLRYQEAAKAFDAAAALLGACPAEHADQWLELMIEGRADLHVRRYEPDLALALLEEARPVIEAHGTPARKLGFYRIWTMQRLLRNGLRADQEDIDLLQDAVAAAKRAGEDKDVGYARYFLGWALWLRGDLADAGREANKALELADRIGETHLRDVSLRLLAQTALRRHDARAVRSLLPRASAAATAVAGGEAGSSSQADLAISAWLAWQDGRPQEVIRLADEIDAQELTTLRSGAKYRWVYLFPLIAARLRSGQTQAAVAAARRIIDPSQQRLPDDLTAALAAAADSWDDANPAQAATHLTAALTLANQHDYF